MSKSQTTMFTALTSCHSFINDKEEINSETYLISVAAFPNKRIIYVEYLSNSEHAINKYTLSDLKQDSTWTNKLLKVANKSLIAQEIKNDLYNSTNITIVRLNSDMYEQFQERLSEPAQAGEHDQDISHALAIKTHDFSRPPTGDNKIIMIEPHKTLEKQTLEKRYIPPRLK